MFDCIQAKYPKIELNKNCKVNLKKLHNKITKEEEQNGKYKMDKSITKT